MVYSIKSPHVIDFLIFVTLILLAFFLLSWLQSDHFVFSVFGITLAIFLCWGVILARVAKSVLKVEKVKIPTNTDVSALGGVQGLNTFLVYSKKPFPAWHHAHFVSRKIWLSCYGLVFAVKIVDKSYIVILGCWQIESEAFQSLASLLAIESSSEA